MKYVLKYVSVTMEMKDIEYRLNCDFSAVLFTNMVKHPTFTLQMKAIEKYFTVAKFIM